MTLKTVLGAIYDHRRTIVSLGVVVAVICLTAKILEPCA